MARNVTLTNLREDVRQRCDLPAYSTSTFITETAVTRMINVSLQSLYAKLMEAWGEGYFTTSASLATVADTATTALPSDFVKLTKLVWLRGTDDVVDVHLAQSDDYGFTQWASRAWDRPLYRLRQGTILWVPKPNQVYNLVCEYVQAPADLSSGGDTFDAGPGWDEYVVLDVARKVFERQDKDARHFIAARNEVERNIVTRP